MRTVYIEQFGTWARINGNDIEISPCLSNGQPDEDQWGSCDTPDPEFLPLLQQALGVALVYRGWGSVVEMAKS